MQYYVNLLKYNKFLTLTAPCAVPLLLRGLILKVRHSAIEKKIIKLVT